MTDLDEIECMFDDLVILDKHFKLDGFHQVDETGRWLYARGPRRSSPTTKRQPSVELASPEDLRARNMARSAIYRSMFGERIRAKQNAKRAAVRATPKTKPSMSLKERRSLRDRLDRAAEVSASMLNAMATTDADLDALREALAAVRKIKMCG